MEKGKTRGQAAPVRLAFPGGSPIISTPWPESIATASFRLVVGIRAREPELALVEAPQPQWPKVHRPEAVGHFLQANVLFSQHAAHVHPALLPANAAVPANAPDFIVRRMSTLTLNWARRPHPKRASGPHLNWA